MDRDSKLLFSIVIPAYNEEKYISSCLNSILETNSRGVNFEIIVVDNGSQDQTVEIARTYANTNVNILTIPDVNVGAVRNYGANEAKGKNLAFIDADCSVDQTWIDKVIQLSKSENVKAYGGGCKLPKNPKWVEKYWLLGQNEQPVLPKDLIGASILISKDIFFRVGGFPENISSGEDTALSSNLKNGGIEIQIIPELSVIHMGNAKTVADFIKRQIWHAESYRYNSNLIKDPVFLLTALFLTFFLALILTGIIASNLTGTFLILLLITPLPLSLKRIYRSNTGLKAIPFFLLIYILDTSYLIGRACGIIKNIQNTR